MKKILVVDDDEKIRAALTIRLGAAGYEVITASNGLDGLKLAGDLLPNLVLLDIGLPLMDIYMPLGVGYSVAWRLKDRGLAHIPVIFLTASRQSGLREAADSIGAAGFMEKPYEPEELLRMVGEVLKANEFRPESPPVSKSSALTIA